MSVVDERTGAGAGNQVVPPALSLAVALVLLVAGLAAVLAPPSVAGVLAGPTLFLAVFAGLAKLMV